MPIVFIVVGAALLASGAQDTQDDLFTLVKNDLTGTPSFVPWFVAILAIGMLGYIKPIEKVSRAFLVLVIVVLFLHNNGFFKQLADALAPYERKTT